MYLQAGIDYAIYKLCEDPDAHFPQCSAEIFVRHSNVLILEGMLQLAHLFRDDDCNSNGGAQKVIGMLSQFLVVTNCKQGCYSFLASLFYVANTFFLYFALFCFRNFHKSRQYLYNILSSAFTLFTF